MSQPPPRQGGPGVPPPPPPFPAPAFAPPLPPGWTEHRAPAGQPYWFNPQTNVSTYTRPLPPPPPPGFSSIPPPPPFMNAPLHFTGNAPAPAPAPVKEKKEKPKTKTPVEGTDWTKVETNKGNVFWTNRVTKESVWTVPGEIREVVEAAEKGKKREREAELVEDKVEVVEKPKEVVQEDPPKKKKQKQVVMRDMAELDKDEDWQRQVAAQMAAEVAEEERVELEETRASPEPAVVEKVEVVAAPPATPAPAAVVHAPKIDVSPGEAIALFKAMLGEKDINPMAPWDNELSKFINDARYTTVRTLRDRRDLFDEFCKEKIRETRAAKKAAAEAGGPKADPLTAFRALLLTTVTSTRTHFSDFKRAHAKDPRYREFGKTEGEREKVFKGWLRELGERKRAEAQKAEERFAQMLREDAGIKAGDKWAEVKLRHVSDPRYDAVNSSSLRESLFTSYLANLSSSTGAAKSVKAARAAASLKEREEQVRGEKERLNRNASAARGAMGREEGEREFKNLLIDSVRDHEARWDSVAPSLERDPRFETSGLNPHDKRRMFDAHLSELYTKRVAAVESLFLTHSPTLTTPFTDVLPHLSSSPHVTRLVGTDFDRLEGLFDAWRGKRVTLARREFEELLRESPILEHWGRLQKKEEGGEGKKIVDEDEDEDEGAIDISEMAKQVDLKAIHAVLKHDKRYLIFDHDPENRSKWIEEFLANLSAPKATVHQRD